MLKLSNHSILKRLYALEKQLLWLLLIVFPFGNLLRFDLGGGVAMLLMDVVLGALFMIRGPRIMRSPKFAISGTLFMCAALISLVFNYTNYTISQLAVGTAYLARFVVYFHLYFVLWSQDSRFKKQYLLALQLVGTTYSVIGLGQYVFFPDLTTLFFQGWDEHLYRVFGTLFDPNFSGAIFAMTFLLTLGYLREQVNMKSDKKSEKMLYYYASSAVLCLVALLLTYSRSSYVMTGVGLLTFALLTKQWKLPFIILSAFVIGIMLLPKNYPGEGVRLLRTASVNSRVEEYKQAVELFKTSPVFGVGFNTYRYAQIQHGYLQPGKSELPLSMNSNHAGAGVPNSYLFVLATTGLFGGAAFAMLGWQILKDHLARKSRADFMISASTAILIGIGVHALFENSLFFPFILVCLIVHAVSTSRSM